MSIRLTSTSVLPLCLAAVLWSGASALTSLASDLGDRSWIAKQTQTSEIDAGIECLERAANQLNAPLDVVALLDSPLLQSKPLDTTRELAELAKEQNLHAVVLDHVTAEQIAACRFPMLIHVYGARYSTKPDYYVLCTGVGGGRVNFSTPAGKQLALPLNQFDPDRRGEAVVISRQPLAAGNPILHRALPIAPVALMAGAALCAGLFSFAQPWRTPRSAATRSERRASVAGLHFLVLFLVAAMLACVDRIATGRPLVPPAVAAGGEPIDFLLPASAKSENSTKTPPEISGEIALRKFSAGSLFVDARDITEFDAGHIKGAISCPATDISRWRLHLAGIDPHRSIVVYCAMASCKKGEYVATFLLANGFTDVGLYRDGWVKWTGSKETR